MRSRKERLENIKRDLYNQWTVLKRAPLLVISTALLIGMMCVIAYLLGLVIKLISG